MRAHVVGQLLFEAWVVWPRVLRRILAHHGLPLLTEWILRKLAVGPVQGLVNLQVGDGEAVWAVEYRIVVRAGRDLYRALVISGYKIRARSSPQQTEEGVKSH